MAFAVNIMHGCGPSNEMHLPVIAKEDLVKAILVLNISAQGIICTVNY